MRLNGNLCPFSGLPSGNYIQAEKTQIYHVYGVIIQGIVAIIYGSFAPWYGIRQTRNTGPVISAAIVYPYIATEQFTEQIVKFAENCTQIQENFAFDFSNIFRGRGALKSVHENFRQGYQNF